MSRSGSKPKEWMKEFDPESQGYYSDASTKSGNTIRPYKPPVGGHTPSSKHGHQSRSRGAAPNPYDGYSSDVGTVSTVAPSGCISKVRIRRPIDTYNRLDERPVEGDGCFVPGSIPRGQQIKVDDFWQKQMRGGIPREINPLRPAGASRDLPIDIEVDDLATGGLGFVESRGLPSSRKTPGPPNNAPGSDIPMITVGCTSKTSESGVNNFKTPSWGTPSTSGDKGAAAHHQGVPSDGPNLHSLGGPSRASSERHDRTPRVPADTSFLQVPYPERQRKRPLDIPEESRSADHAASEVFSYSNREDSASAASTRRTTMRPYSGDTEYRKLLVPSPNSPEEPPASTISKRHRVTGASPEELLRKEEGWKTDLRNKAITYFDSPSLADRFELGRK